MLHDHRQGGRDHVGPVAADHQIDFVHIQQLGVEAGNGGWVGLVVVKHQLHRPAEQAAFGVDLVFPDLHRQQRRLAVRSQSARQRHAEADGDGVRRPAPPVQPRPATWRASSAARHPFRLGRFSMIWVSSGLISCRILWHAGPTGKAPWFRLMLRANAKGEASTMQDLDEFTVTDEALRQMAGTENPRLKEIGDAAVQASARLRPRGKPDPRGMAARHPVPDRRRPGMQPAAAGVHSAVGRAGPERGGQRAARQEGPRTWVAEQPAGAVLSRRGRGDADGHADRREADRPRRSSSMARSPTMPARRWPMR